jgi:hypothetical protein
MFAKLFDTPNGQLLAFKTLGDDDDPIIRIIGEAVGGVVPSASLGYEGDEDRRDAAFEKLNQSGAEQQAKGFRDMLTKMFPKSIEQSA